MLPLSIPIRFLLNPRADAAIPYGAKQEKVLNRKAHEAAFKEISAWDEYAPTPLLHLEGMAGALGIRNLWYKDEGSRFGLGSFKALGGIYGVGKLLEKLEAEGKPASDITVTCASAGNHGRAVARGAEKFGCRSVIFLPKRTSSHRISAIEALGGQVVLTEGGFDDAVRVAAREAERNGWHVVADTSCSGYETVPRHIMQGYTVLAREVLDQLQGEGLPSHVFLQAGVGGLAGAVTGHFWERLGPERPRIVVVEPAEADCLFASGLRGRPTPSPGNLQTAMECLACRAVSGLAWDILAEGADAFLTISDSSARETVDLLRGGVGPDSPILTQPSGAAGLAGLFAAMFEPGLAEPLRLGETSRVLVFGSEGPA